MDPLEVGILVTAVSINFLLLGFVYYRNPRSATHRLFALLVLVMSLWSVTNFFAVNAETKETALWFIRGVMFFATPMSVILFFLMHTFPRSTMSLSKRTILTLTGLTVLSMAVALSPFLFPEVTFIPGSAHQPIPGPGLLIFIPISVGTILLGIYYLARKTIKARGIEKIQMQFLMLGVIIMFTLIISLNFVSVVVFNTSAFNKFGPLFTLPFTLLTTYTIVRYRLMDVRAAVARSLSFSFLLGAFFLLYASILIFAVPFLESTLQIPASFLAAAGALLAVLLARYVQDALRRVTDRFLFQQQQNYREALLKVTQKLSRTIQIKEVTDTILNAMKDVVRSKKTIIFIQDSSGKEFIPQASFGAENFNVSIPSNHKMMKHLRHVNNTIVNDELTIRIEHETKPEHQQELKDLQGAMKWYDAAAIMPLFVDKGLTGFILLGEKISGQPYLQDDVEFLSALAPQASTTLENARLYKESLEFGAKLKAEVKRATHELEIANEQLQDLDKAKSEFLSIASHQLYTPLTAIRGYLSMLTEGDFGQITEEQKPVIDILNKSSVRLIELIKNLLDIARIESGRFELNLKSFDLSVMAKELVQDLMPNAMAKDLQLIFVPPDQPLPHVIADRQRIRQVMLNFIDNSIKYTNRGRINVTVRQDHAELVFSVTDTGKGLDAKEITKLFTKFTRVGGADRYHTEGTGLGLYVARQIIREHHGDVEVTSPGKDQGSTFSMRVPTEDSPHSLKLGEKASVVIKAAEAGEAGEPAPA